MKNSLLFNTISSSLTIVLQKNNSIIATKLVETKKQSEIIISNIEAILEENSLDYQDIDVFSCINGPGNFTAIKTSLALLKAIKISTNKQIIINNMFEIISHNTFNWDLIILDINNTKNYIQQKNGEFLVVYKKDINNFIEELLKDNKDIKIITNDAEINNIHKNTILSQFSIEKWCDIVNKKIENNDFVENIEPLYIEEALITKSKK